MKQFDEYECHEFTRRDGLWVSDGRDKVTDQPVQVHLFPAHAANEADRLRQLVAFLPEEAQNKIVKTGQGEGGGYFVTEPLPAGQFLKSWIEDQAIPANPRGVPEISTDTAVQLRQMGIRPAALGPLLPGPDIGMSTSRNPEADGTQRAHPGTAPAGATQYIRRMYGDQPVAPPVATGTAAQTSQPLPAATPPPPAVVSPRPPVGVTTASSTAAASPTEFMRRLYAEQGEGPREGINPVVQQIVIPQVAPAPEKREPGLDTFIGLVKDFPGPGQARAPETDLGLPGAPMFSSKASLPAPAPPAWEPRQAPPPPVWEPPHRTAPRDFADDDSQGLAGPVDPPFGGSPPIPSRPGPPAYLSPAPPHHLAAPTPQAHHGRAEHRRKPQVHVDLKTVLLVGGILILLIAVLIGVIIFVG